MWNIKVEEVKEEKKTAKILSGQMYALPLVVVC